ncbi:hypothetical protein OG462_41045 [Streptomyces sp. NBC_01077]|uniref:hypothetical protein n=1 Tax=Streptomyces sp. NBC_01077 TaxID=2903746 RepID=UPI003866EE62|nr:hypothetical protein OG462_41045 [Streptomyces sp. NBC_01077]
MTTAGFDVVGVCVPRERAREVREEWRGRHGETGWWPYVTLDSPTDLAEGCRESRRDVWVVEEVAHADDDLESRRADYDPARLAPLLAPPLKPGRHRQQRPDGRPLRVRHVAGRPAFPVRMLGRIAVHMRGNHTLEQPS